MALKTLQFPIVLATDDDDEQPQETAVDLLPDPILEEILSRVPAKSLLCWKSVSKPWLRTLDDPIFARSQFSRASFCPLLVFSEKYKSVFIGRIMRPRGVMNSSRIMHLVEGQNVSELDPKISKSSKLRSRFDFNTQVAGPSIIRYRIVLPENMKAISCEGVVCWLLHDHPDGDCIFICNPITGEYASLSPLPLDNYNFYYVFIGIGFCRVTKKFELLRMSAVFDENDDQVRHWWPEVRTLGLGDRCWRRVGDGTFELDLLQKIWQVVYVNGAIYWSYYGDSNICCFNFDRAIFQVIPLPKIKFLMLETNSFALENMSLGVLADSLCVSLISPDDGHVELWILENINGVSQVKWNKLYDVETKTTHLEHRGILWPRGQYKAIKYLQHGEILMHDWRGKFLIYDPITKEERHFCVLQDSCFEDMRKDGFDKFQVVPHVPCLVKLKEALNIDEEGARLIEEEESYPGDEFQFPFSASSLKLGTTGKHLGLELEYFNKCIPLMSELHSLYLALLSSHPKHSHQYSPQSAATHSLAKLQCLQIQSSNAFPKAC